ncbi:HU family DNA-binding protein [uncultured Fibrobacter sp.]|uniref:HU family DNA-binding protein n=1 Tax=uncultured Fibrobacter sp. TaxID=261512 RepID=UPI00261F7A94|nr:HU family DNA-binding protein [uncultured Fibrobacter sp.]
MAVNGKLKYYPVARKNPKNVSQTKYYAQLYQYSLIERDQILEAASRNSSIPKAYIGMVYDALGEEMLNFVRNGHSITLANFGTIYTTIKSRPSETPEKVDATNVKRVKFHFKPCARMRKALQPYLLSFEKVQKVKGNYQAPAEP